MFPSGLHPNWTDKSKTLKPNSQLFPMWKDETDEEYCNRVDRLIAIATHNEFIVLIHDKTFTAGMRGVEVFQPKQKYSFTCEATEPERVHQKTMCGLQELIDLSGIVATIDNTWMEINGKPVILGDNEEDKIFQNLHPKAEPEPVLEPEPEPKKPVPVQTKIGEKPLDLISKRLAEEAKAKAEKERLEKEEFEKKDKAEKEKAKKGLEKWF